MTILPNGLAQLTKTVEPKGLSQGWFKLRPHPKQIAAWTSPKRFVALLAGRQSGKTEIALRKIVRECPVIRGDYAGMPHRYAYLGPTRGQAKATAWERLQALIPEHWLEEEPHESELKLKLRIGDHRVEIRVCGMDKPKRFEGVPYDGVVFDESSDQRDKVWELNVRPTLVTRTGWAWRIGVPKRVGYGIKDYRKFCEIGFKGSDPDIAAFTWSSADILPAAEIESVKRNLDLKDYLEQYGGQFVDAGGSAFYSFSKDGNVRNVPYDRNAHIFVGSDFNVNPMAWILAHCKDGQNLEVFDEIWLRDTNTQKTLNVLYERYGATHQGSFSFYGDASSANRHTAATSSDYAQILNDKRFIGAKTHYPKANPPVKNRLSSCNMRLHNAAGERHIFIDPRCTHLIDDLETRGVDDSGSPEDATDDMGHITDAFGYLVHRKWPCTLIESSGKKDQIAFKVHNG